MDIDEIRALLAVAEHGSFVSAARSVAMTRSTLRRRVDELEARVGAALLVRSVSGARLTPVGELVAREGRLVVEHARAMVQTAKASTGLEPGALVVVLQQGLPAEPVATVLQMLAPALQGACVEVVYSASPRSSLVDDADLVVVVAAAPPEGAWEAIRLRDMQTWLLASDAYMEQRGAPRALGELEDHPIAVWRDGSGDPSALPLRSGGALTVQPVLVTSDIHLLHTLASGGHALVYAPDAQIQTLLPGQNRLTPQLPDLVGAPTAMWLIAPPSAQSSPRVRALLEAVRAMLPVG